MSTVLQTNGLIGVLGLTASSRRYMSKGQSRSRAREQNWVVVLHYTNEMEYSNKCSFAILYYPLLSMCSIELYCKQTTIETYSQLIPCPHVELYYILGTFRNLENVRILWILQQFFYCCKFSLLREKGK